MSREAEKKSLYNVETPDRETEKPRNDPPLCCQRCAHYRPTFFLKIGRECAAFGTVEGVLDDKCGFYAPK